MAFTANDRKVKEQIKSLQQLLRHLTRELRVVKQKLDLDDEIQAQFGDNE